MDELVLRDRDDTLYEKLAHFSGTLFGGVVKEPKNPEIKEGIDFTGLRVTTKEVESFAVLAAIAAAVVFIVITFLSLAGIIDLPWYVMALLIIGAPMGAYAFYSEYPKSYASIYRIKAVGSMPELISNLAISLKLVPNLENAAGFASRTTRGHMGLLLKRMLWGTYTRSYTSAEQAIVSLADRWKRWNDDFARALYLLRTSLEERSEARRLAVLDKAVDTILKGTAEKIDDFASSLYMPTMTFYFMGVIIPLVLIAVLPVIAFTGGGGLGAKQLAVIYDILLPVIMLYATSWILNRRPVTIPPPDIKEHPDVPPEGAIRFSSGKKSYSVNGKLLAAIVALPFIAVGLYRFMEVINKPPETATTAASAVAGTGIQEQAAVPFLGLDLTLLVLLGFALGLFIYFVGTNWQRKKVRDDILQTEREFIDGLNQLGNRLSDGKPMEDAIAHVARVMGNAKVSKVFNDAARAVTVGRASIRSAFFDEREGALRYVYSDTIRNVLYKVIEGNEKGAQTASITIFRTVEQLQKVQAIERDMKKKLDEVVTPMRLIIVGVGPAVAGVVVVLQKLINSYLLKSNFTAPGSVSGVSGSGLPSSVSIPVDTSKLEFASKSIPSELLLIIVGIYLVLMVLILSRYMAGINHGEDRVATQMEMGTNVLISVVIYIIVIAFTGLFLGSVNIQM